MTLNNSPDITTDLINRARNGGDAEAIGTLYEMYRVSIYRYLFYRTGDAQAADDLTSEVFLRMIAALAGYRIQGVSFQAWLFQIAHNLLIDHYRKMSHRDDVELEDAMMTDTATTIPQNVERSLTSVTLRQALNRLSSEQRDVIVLRFVAGMPIAEVAQTLNKSEDAIKGLQRRGLLALREVLSDWEVLYA